jgi:cytoskeleton protein RodZ
MSEAAATGSGGASAGRLLRQAREARGLHLDALAGAIKVAPNKLEALEADRYDQLLDATFARALAQTVCRTLKIDAAPVLALLPRPGANRLGEGGQNLNAPFYEAQGPASGGDYSGLARPAVWGPLLLVIIAAGVYLMPHDWLASFEARRAALRDRSDPAVASAGVPQVGTVVETVQSTTPTAGATASLPAPTPAPADTAAPAAMPASTQVAAAETATSTPVAPAPKLLQVHVSAQSWIEVIDVRGQSLISRTVQPGENVELDGPVPLKVKVGNAAATEIVFRGQALELAPFTRGNLARFELK